MVVDPPAIVAMDDDFTSMPIPAAGGDTPTVFGDDTLNGAAFAPADVTPSIVDADGLTGVSINLDGTLSVPANTPAGTYNVEYQICEVANPTNCDTATATVTVAAPAAPSLDITKIANNDTNVAPGTVVTYTYTVENDGNVDVTDVTVTDVHNGSASLGAITIDTLTNTSGNSADDGADALVDTLAPGDTVTFTAEYIATATDLVSGSPVTNTATATGTPASGTFIDPTATESISLSGTPRAPLAVAATCGAFTREGFVFETGSIANDQNVDFGSGFGPGEGPGVFGAMPYDPYVLEPLFSRDPVTGVVNFFQTTPDATANGVLTTTGPNAGDILADADQLSSISPNQPVEMPEIWRVAARIEGTPGTTETITISTAGGQDHTAFWQTDVSGNIINTNSNVIGGNDEGWIFGAGPLVDGSEGTQFQIDVTYPADGVVIIRFAQFDATLALGGLQILGYECPDPSLSLTKTLTSNADGDSSSSVTVGDVLTYTITATNDGNVSQTDVVVSDPLLDAPNDTTTCPTVAVNGTCVLTGTHTVTAAEVNAGMVDNTASTQSDQVTTAVEAFLSTPAEVNPIVAMDDDFTATPIPAAGGNTPTVFGDDTLNGAAFAPADVTPSIVDADGLTGVSINADGTLSVPANTPAGTYNVEYQICEVANPTNCDTAIATVVVDPPAIVAMDDDFTCLLYTSPSPRDRG